MKFLSNLRGLLAAALITLVALQDRGRALNRMSDSIN